MEPLGFARPAIDFDEFLRFLENSTSPNSFFLSELLEKVGIFQKVF